MIDYYEILEVSPNANAEALQRAYHVAIAKYKPEQFHSHYKQYATQHIKRINDAYQLLADPVQRRRYDVRLSHSTRIAEPSKANKKALSLLRMLGIAFLVMITLNFAKFLVLLPAFKIVAPLILIVAVAAFWYYRRKHPQGSHPGGHIKR